MQADLIGPHPFEKDEKGRQGAVIGTVFPSYNIIYTRPPAIHACQRFAFIDHLNEQRALDLKPPLTEQEAEAVSAGSVDLIFEPEVILIRPDPMRMDLAFEADEILQTIFSKRQIKFLNVSHASVREAIQLRGECWRLSSLPKTIEGKQKLVFSSRIGIHGLPLYFYNRLTGTRWLTWQSFCDLGTLDDAGLVQHLQEIADLSVELNRRGKPEIAFFGAELRRFGAEDFANFECEQFTSEQLRGTYKDLRERFRLAVLDSLHKDDCKNRAWSERMIQALFLDGNEAQTERLQNGWSSEFFLQVEWLPGGRFEEGEFLFDSIFEEASAHPENSELQQLCDSRAKGIIFNLIREFGDLEYINVGRVPESLSLARPQKRGRRGVYLAELKSKSDLASIKRFARLQKWGVWEHLNEGKDLLQSIEESEEYSDYWLDRRLGCIQLGMNLTRRVVMRRLSEVYLGEQKRFQGQVIRTTYFEREYLAGIATDKVPLEQYSNPAYALAFATLLGRAGASSMIVGRSLDLGTRPIFDDGDEVVLEDKGLPKQILLGDHSGAFGEYQQNYVAYAPHYARPVNARASVVPDAQAFAEAYLSAFRMQFAHVQNDYRKRRRAFDTLFKHCRYDKAGSFAYRWECVLRRLDQADVNETIGAIRQQIRVLNSLEPSPAASTAANP